VRVRSPVRALLPAVLCAVLAGGCGTTVNGRGTFAGSAAAPGSPSASAPGSASPSGAPRRVRLSCTGGAVIQPPGAPYCFLVPNGFTDVSSSVSVDATIGSERYRSAVAVQHRQRDLIIVTTYELRIDADPIPDTVLVNELRGVLGRLSKQGFSFDNTEPKRSTVDGARTFGFHAREASAGLQADVYFAFRGRNELEINCQWKDAPSDVRRGCRSVLSGIQFKTVA
jgi:hypothetical protein